MSIMIPENILSSIPLTCWTLCWMDILFTGKKAVKRIY